MLGQQDGGIVRRTLPWMQVGGFVDVGANHVQRERAVCVVETGEASARAAGRLIQLHAGLARAVGVSSVYPVRARRRGRVNWAWHAACRTLPFTSTSAGGGSARENSAAL